MSLTTIPSLVKWSGSKRKQAPFLARLAPPYTTYFEPFLGGGSMLYLAKPSHRVVGDIYKPLVDIWMLVKESPTELTEDYTKRWHKLQEELIGLRRSGTACITNNIRSRQSKSPVYYYKCRDHFNATGCPFSFNFLLRTCVNGIVRFNAKGEFNNSFHLSRDGMHPSRFKSAVLSWHYKLQDVQIYCLDYRELVERAVSGDFVYFDPPYLGCVNRYASPIQQSDFFALLDVLNQRDIKWMVSLDGHSGDKDYRRQGVPDDLYVFHQYLSNGRGLTNGVLNGKEGTVFESVYTNYLPDHYSDLSFYSQMLPTANLKPE